MTVLIAEQKRFDIKLDTFNKGFTWAALQLRQQTLSTAELTQVYGTWIQVSHELVKLANNVNQPKLNLKVQLPLLSANFLLRGGLIGQSVGSFAPTAVAEINQIYRAAMTPNLVTAPTWVLTLEQYCYWCATRHAALLTDANRKELDIKVNENANPNAFVIITAALPMLSDPLLSGLSYIDSINSLAPVGAPPFGNSYPLGNATTAGN
jgi:hypothetical protein